MALTSDRPRVALAHDYITQRGGAERVVVIMAEAFPDAPVYTTLYAPATTFADFEGLDIRPSRANVVPLFRRDHRLAFPVLAPLVSTMRVDAEALLVSSSGWAHGIRSSGKKIVYCHAPARWLYQRDRYLGPTDDLGTAQRARRALAAAAVGVLGSPLRGWDRRQALGADRYLVNSSVIRDAVRDVYGIDAEVLPPPPAMLPGGPEAPLEGVREPFALCVARLLPYKNVAEVVRAAMELDVELVVVGRGPDRERLDTIAAGHPRIHLVGGIDEPQLRWAYAHCAALVAASYEDFGLSPLEAAAFGKPTVAFRAGGYLDTIEEGLNGVFFAEPQPDQIAAALQDALARDWDVAAITAHADRFGARHFVQRLHEVVDAELT